MLNFLESLGFFVRLKFAGESEGELKNSDKKNQGLKKYLQKSATENGHPQTLKKSVWPFPKMMIFLHAKSPPSIKILRCDLEFSSTTALGSWRQTYRRLLGLKAARSGK